mmetsp:Transcript_31904/g.48210  ORF Transcript_31904/g.48210 Transcript_31904/m.48210 type:complete len:326 (-) Transcript_31904:818-1795(-)
MKVQELLSPLKEGKAALLFWAPWHEDSVSIKESIFPALATSSSPSIEFRTVEAEAQPTICEEYGVTVVPTVVLVGESGQVKELIEGNVEVAQITQAVQRLINSAAAENPNAITKNTEESLNDRLGRLVRSSEVMLFMKGTPAAPRCGFSRQTVELLSDAKIPFGSFDILSDEDVRQGLKTFSDWPTYPQLYANGELIGGLDILKEMVEDNTQSLSDQLGVASRPTLEARLQKLVQRNHCMLFMKGVPSAPRCGFSRQIVELLDKEGVSYDAFNILEDEEVRQGLKKFSDWPTYPQLYVDGDLVGGLDICKEMAESGDLIALLKGN